MKRTILFLSISLFFLLGLLTSIDTFSDPDQGFTILSTFFVVSCFVCSIALMIVVVDYVDGRLKRKSKKNLSEDVITVIVVGFGLIVGFFCNPAFNLLFARKPVFDPESVYYYMLVVNGIYIFVVIFIVMLFKDLEQISEKKRQEKPEIKKEEKITDVISEELA